MKKGILIIIISTLIACSFPMYSYSSTDAFVSSGWSVKYNSSLGIYQLRLRLEPNKQLLNDDIISAMKITGNWGIANPEDKIHKPDKIFFQRSDSIFYLTGKFDYKQTYKVTFIPENWIVEIPGTTDSLKNFDKLGWDKFFTEFKGDWELQTVAEEEAPILLDYDVFLRVWESRKTNLSFNINAKGSITSNFMIRNGTETSSGLTYDCFIKFNNYPYKVSINSDFSMEGIQSGPKLSDLTWSSNSFHFYGLFEVPYSAEPVKFIHGYTNYLRISKPLVVKCGLRYGQQRIDNDSTIMSYEQPRDEENGSQVDIDLNWELPFSQHLLIKLDYQFTKDFESEKDYNYYEVIIGKFLGGPASSEKRYIFFKYTDGEKRPDFKKTTERMIGFAMFF